MLTKIVTDKITLSELTVLAQERFGDLVKAVVDIEKGIMAVGGDLHADQEAVLLEQGSAQQNLWGINLYPSRSDADFIEFDSMINVRPSQANRSRSVESAELKTKISKLVNKLLQKP